MAKITSRVNTRPVKVGNLVIGGKDEVIIQSMTTTKTTDIEASAAQIKSLASAGCQLARVAVPDLEAAKCLGELKSKISIPLVADIHFDYRLALEAVNQGVDKLRINPGNIGRRDRVVKVVNACREKKIPIRIGVNAGSLEKKYLLKGRYPTAQAMVASAQENIRILEELDFKEIIVSLKASDINLTIEAYQLASRIFNYPLHLGITESGPLQSGAIKSAAGLGVLLNQGIGDTLRISLSADPLEEIKVAKILLNSFGLISNTANLISCPTCGRVQIDLIPIACEIETYLQKIKTPITVAVMGCAVNGPGEACAADIGLAGRGGAGVIFKKGKIIKAVPKEEMLSELKKEIDRIVFLGD